MSTEVVVAAVAGIIVALIEALVRLRFEIANYKLPDDDDAIIQELRQIPFSPQQRRIASRIAFEGPGNRHRTVRKLEFLSPEVVRFQMSLDFSIPEDAAAEPVLVPLVLVRKRKLSGIDLRDEDERSLPVINQEQERLLVTWLLCLLWTNLFTSRNERLDRQAVAAMYRMVKSNPEQAVHHYRVMVSWLPQVADADRLRDFLGVASAYVDSAQLFGQLDASDSRRRRIVKVAFLDDAPWRFATPARTISRFVRGLLARPFDAVTWMSDRLSLEQRQRLDRDENGRERAHLLRAPYGEDPQPRPWRELVANLRGLGRGGLSRVGFMSRPYGGSFSAFHSQSEHLEVEAPPGTSFSGGHLKQVVEMNGRVHVIDLDYVERRAFVAHLHCSHGLDDQSSPGRREFEVRLRAQARGWLLHVAVSIAVCLALLEASWAKSDELVQGASGSLVAIALGIGAVAVVYLARPNEHPMTTRLLEGPRLALVLTACFTLGAIVLLAVAPGQVVHHSAVDGPTFEEDGWVPVVGAAVALALVLLNYLGAALGSAITLLRPGSR